MKFSLIICTYMRPKPLVFLLESVKKQTLYPDEILIIDGSGNNQTEQILRENHFENLQYILAPVESRGLTRQRNFGVSKVNPKSEIIAFVDDDTELMPDYFEELIKTFQENEAVSGVGGVAVNENNWQPAESGKHYKKSHYLERDGYVYKEGQRNIIRNLLGLQSDLGPNEMPEYSHGKTCGFPLNGKIHEVHLLIGLSFSFRKKVFDNIRFSPYFEGYGLYEDADFSLRALEFGKNVINTKVQLNHFHDSSGRPNQYKYGKMVVRNGWYVWRIRNPKPSLKAKLKWNLITILLTIIRFSNTFTTNNKKEAFTEALGRTTGWWSLIFHKPKHIK